MEKFSILIPTWNNLPYLTLCIESIRAHSHFDHQIIVHVNEGTDGTLEWLAEQQDIDFTYTPHNAGICYALNIGRTLVTTDYIVYMNDDMYACPGWDKELDREIQAVNNNLFFFSSTSIEPVASSNCVIEKDFGTGISSFRKQELLQHFSDTHKSDWQGATWPPNIVHRDTWDLVGGYSTEFSPGMYSDPDFSMKLWNAGVRLFKGIGNSRVYHFRSKSTQRHVVLNRGYHTFISKWGITSSTLTKYFLRRGEAFDGPLKEPNSRSIIRLKNFFKRIGASIRE
jgi:glycosyltransferase involved in cell wall biosynthesis